MTEKEIESPRSPSLVWNILMGLVFIALGYYIVNLVSAFFSEGKKHKKAKENNEPILNKVEKEVSDDYFKMV